MVRHGTDHISPQDRNKGWPCKFGRSEGCNIQKRAEREWRKFGEVTGVALVMGGSEEFDEGKEILFQFEYRRSLFKLVILFIHHLFQCS